MIMNGELILKVRYNNLTIVICHWNIISLGVFI